MARHADTMIADTELKPEAPILHLTTRQARCIHLMPGILIRLARLRPVLWRGEMVKVTDR